MSQPHRPTANAKERDQDQERDHAAIAIAVVLGVSKNLFYERIGHLILDSPTRACHAAITTPAM